MSTALKTTLQAVDQVVQWSLIDAFQEGLNTIWTQCFVTVGLDTPFGGALTIRKIKEMFGGTQLAVRFEIAQK